MIGWTLLSPSRIERRWRWTAALVSLVMALSLMSVANTALVWLLAMLLLLAVPAVVWRRSQPEWRLRLGADGVLELAQGDEDGRAAHASFVSRHLIVLVCGSRFLACWPDALSPDHYRQVSVHVRWPSPSRAPAHGDDDGV